MQNGQSYGLMVVKTNRQLMDDEQAARDASAPKLEDTALSQLAGVIKAAWERNKNAKMVIEERMLRCLRQRVGEYDPEEKVLINQSGGTDIYMMLTATKCNAAAAWIQDILLPPGDKAWALDPSPIPDLPQMAVQAIAQRIRDKALAQYQQQGAMPSDAELMTMAEELTRQVEDQVKETAKESAEKMTLKIEDAMEEGGWRHALEEFIEDFVTFPTAFVKGPIIRKSRKLSWAQGFKPVIEETLSMHWERTSPFDLYPSPNAKTLNHGPLVEHVRYTLDELHGMIGVPGYKDDAIESVLTNYREGKINHWCWNEAERKRLEGENLYWRTPAGQIDGLHYWGSVSGMSLLEWGMDPKFVRDPLAQYEIEAIMIGSDVIRCEINRNPLKERPYHSASYRKIAGSIWGQSPPELMRDTQKVCNATARSLVNNMAVASGPQVEVEVDRLPPETVVENVYPWKIWQTKSDPFGSTRRAVNFFQPNINAQELIAVYEHFERKADDETQIPRYTYGNERVGGAGETASGLSMLMDATAKGIRKGISHVDSGVIQPTVIQAFVHFMLYDPDQSIKGDVQVTARGAAALVMKEQARVRRHELLALTNNPVDIQIMGLEGRAELLRENIKGMGDVDANKVVPSRVDLMQKLSKAGNQPPPDVIKAQLQAETADKDREADKEMNAQDNLTQLTIAGQREKTTRTVKERDNQVKREAAQTKGQGKSSDD